ncbi:MAG: A/G-specific adenine glycosylase [Provencibacterium sp.]|jgi:A/G-specific adenine glycosylase|nr:A/G-specific adenine glycosylase [Provencibacterium sp.]
MQLFIDSEAGLWRTAFAQPLLGWYDRHARVLPWRSDPTPYHVFVSEIMLQQTRVEPAIPYYERFIRELPDLQALAVASPEHLHKLWEGLGYYSRVQNMQRTAKKLCGEFRGEFPDSLPALLSLPGIGEYTAGAILSIAFSRPVPAVDGNVLRVLSRIALYREDIASPRAKKEIGALISRFIPQERPGDFNQALMDLGAGICRPHAAPFCEDCPVRECCSARKEGCAAALPLRAPKKERRTEERTIFLVLSKRGVLLHRRPAQGLLAGLWEFPGLPGRCGAAEAAALFPPGAVFSALAPARHIFTHVQWQMSGFLVRLNDIPALPEEENWRWANLRALQEEYAVPSAFKSYFRLACALERAAGEAEAPEGRALNGGPDEGSAGTSPLR